MSVTNSSLAVAERAQEGPKEGTIDTRFGRFEVDFDKAIRIPRGIIGFETAYSFILLDVPGESNQAFKLLQSLDDPALGFIVLPLSPQDEAIAEADLQASCAAFGVAREDAAFLLIVTVRPDAEGTVRMTVNLRAPLLLDTRTQTGWQVVLSDQSYSIRHPLT